jgi:ribosomal protein S15P/S13E
VHIQSPGHAVHSSFTDGLSIIFPDFESKALIGSDDIYLDATPFQDTASISSSTDPVISSGDEFCRHITQFQNDVTIESSKVDNLLNHLRQHNKDIKTRRQLNLEVPAGFRQENRLQRTIKDAMLYHLSQEDSDIVPIPEQSMDLPTMTGEPTHDESSVSTSSTTTTVITNNTSTHQAPILRCKRNLSVLYQDTINLDSLPQDAVLDPGDFATMKKTPRNTTPVPRPHAFGGVIHCDIIFGPEVALANVHYGLLFTDRFSRMTYILPLQNLNLDIIKQLDYFFAQLGFVPRQLISDFDLKLIGGKARDHLNQLLVHVNAAPSYRQDRNGLAERHWQTVKAMARSWLASAELPGKFWFHAVKRSAEICNYFPVKLDDGTMSTPLELAHIRSNLT